MGKKKSNKIKKNRHVLKNNDTHKTLPDISKDIHLNILIIIFLILSTIISYWNVVGNDFVNFDDYDYVIDNSMVREGLSIKGIGWALTSFHAGNWHPLTWVSHMADSQFFGLNPSMRHFVSLLIHLMNGLLLYLLLKKITGEMWKSAFVAALFLLHPLHVESVAWISERKDVLCTLFFLLTILAYSRYVTNKGPVAYSMTVIFFAFGLMAKPMLVTLPFVLLLLDFWPFNRVTGPNGADEKMNGSFFSKNVFLVAEKTPLFILSGISCVLTYMAQKKGELVSSLDYISLGDRIANALVSYVGYIVKMFVPLNLAAYYPFPDAIPLWKTAGAALLLIILSMMVLKLGGRYKFLVAGWLFYIGTLVPVIGFVHVGGQAMADRYTYIPFIGLFLLVAWGVPLLLKKITFSNQILILLSCIILPALGLCTWNQVRYWKNSLTLWERTIAVTGDNYSAHNMLGAALFVDGDVRMAIEHFSEALRINPNHEKSHNNLGVAYERAGKNKEALYHYQKALALKPDFYDAHNNMGVILGRQGNVDEAILHFSEAIRIKPDLAKAHYNLGTALVQKRDLKKALHHFSEALRINPEYEEARKKVNLINKLYKNK